jgi:hypothetical protein
VPEDVIFVCLAWSPGKCEVRVFACYDLAACIVVKADCVIVFELVGKSCLEMGVSIQPYISAMNRTTPVVAWSRGWGFCTAGFVLCCIS